MAHYERQERAIRISRLAPNTFNDVQISPANAGTPDADNNIAGFLNFRIRNIFQVNPRRCCQVIVILF